jgi:hypothetical protein
MSWGGEMADKKVDEEETQRTVREVRGGGIDQGDVRMANILWNEEKKRAMLIDFKQAKYIKCSGEGPSVAKNAQALQEISPNKKRKRFESSKRLQRVW